MASRDQITKNVRDVNNGWQGFRDLIHGYLPSFTSFVNTARNLTHTRRRYHA
jgi:protein involved in sex pheromone biosynthesis